MEDERESLQNFLNWATKLGISDAPNLSQSTEVPLCLGHSLLVSYFPRGGGRGLAAARDLRKGELILRVPKSALLTSETLLKDQKLSILVEMHPSLSSTQILTVCLLAEMGKGKSSCWYPYLMQLPRSYDTLACFTSFETQAFQVDDAIWATEKAILQAESEWKEAVSLMQELKLKSQLLTFRSWLWASATISSRSLHIPWDVAGCLCPVGDLFNYAAPGEELLDHEDISNWRQISTLEVGDFQKGDTEERIGIREFHGHSERLTDGGYEEEVDAYCFYARKNYKKGEQVLLSYGTYTNLELLQYYGFLLNENPNNKAIIFLEPNIYASSSWPRDSLYIQQNGKPSFALLSALRLWATPPNQRRSVGHLAYSGSQLSAENEIITMRWLEKNCHLNLEKLPTSVEEDTLLLHAINKIQENFISGEFEKVKLLCGGEVDAFFEANGGAKFQLSGKTKRCMERWKLAVQWRLRYKRILHGCISYCNETISYLSSQNVSSKIINYLSSKHVASKRTATT